MAAAVQFAMDTCSCSSHVFFFIVTYKLSLILNMTNCIVKAATKQLVFGRNYLFFCDFHLYRDCNIVSNDL